MAYYIYPVSKPIINPDLLLTTRVFSTMSFKNVLIAVDNSKGSMKAVEQGLSLSTQLGAKSALVFVIDTAKARGNVDAGIMPREQLAKLKKEASTTFKRITAKYTEQQFECFTPEDKPSKGIVKVAEEWGADLIVMGTRGNSGLKRLLMGSTAENVIRLSSIPILIVPSKM